MNAATTIYKTPAGESEIMALYDAALGRWPVPYETFKLPTRHGETFVIASGEKSAPALMLLHGAQSNAVSWVGDVAEYSASFRTYAVDLPGEPGKSAQNRPDWEGPAYVEWLEDVLDGLGVQQTALLGISQGGWTALKFATGRPGRVSKLVLLAPGGVMPTRRSFIFKGMAYSMFGSWGAGRINRMVFGRQVIHPEAVKFMDAILTHVRPRIGKEYLFTDEELQRLEMPVLLIGGTEDAIIQVEEAAARLRKLLPRLEVILLPGMGHALIGMTGRAMPFLTA
ncbi:MAG: alpha/beta hydrolase [Chloroflexota bacterium]